MGKREENRRLRVGALVEAGQQLFLAQGIEPVSIDELTRAAGMAKGNFYRYFSDKGELVEAILSPVASDARTTMRRATVNVGRSDTREALLASYAQLALDLAALGLREKRVVQLYLQEKRAPATASTKSIRGFSAEMDTGALALTEMAISRGLLRVSDPRVSALAVVGAIETLTLEVVSGRLDTPPDEIARIVVAMVVEGLGVR